jgi:hypothetical protein
MLYTPRRLFKIYATRACMAALALLFLFVALAVDLWFIGLVGMIFVTSVATLVFFGIYFFNVFMKDFLKARHYWERKNRKKK